MRRSLRSVPSGLLLAAALASAACGDSTEPAVSQRSIFAGTVSDPVSGSGVTSVHGLVTEAFVSLAPGTSPGAASARITNRRSGGEVTTVMADGGFDPVAVPALAGDTLDITITLGDGELAYAKAGVPARRQPRVVRTRPVAGRTDVALSASIVVIFSEPIDLTTLSGGGIRLLRDGEAVDGTIRPAPESSVGVEFVPVEPLEPGTQYDLVLTSVIQDLSGDGLEAASRTSFTTMSGESGPSPIPVPPAFVPPAGSRLEFSTQPADVVELTPFAAPVTVTLRDAEGATISGFTGFVSLRVIPEPGGDVWVPNPTAQAVAGVARFERFAVPVTGGAITLVATAEPAAPATSAPFAVLRSPWDSKAQAPTQRVYAASAVAGGRLYVAGGTSDTEDFSVYLATMDAYDPGTNSWSVRAPMPTARVRAGAAALDGLIYVAGGNDGSGLLATVEAYDPVTDQWITRAPMPVARAHPALVAFDGRLYAIGGIGANGIPLGTVDVYDPATNQWSTRRSMPEGRALSGVAEEGGILYAVGGGSGFTASTQMQAYDPVSNLWSSRASLPDAQGFSGVVAAGGRILVVAGAGNEGVVNDVAAYDPNSNTWARTASIPRLGGVTYAGVIDGVVYAVVDGFATFALPVPAM